MITISITRQETVIERTKEWLQVREQTDTQHGNTREYVEADKPVKRTVTILEQTVDTKDFDLKAVIAAVNGMGRRRRTKGTK